MKNIKQEFTPRLSEIIQDIKKSIPSPILVCNGITSYVDIEKFNEYIVDINTFDKEGNADIFNKEWFSMIFTQMTIAQDVTILSHQQYAYILEYITPEFFKNRTIIINDNLRSLYPISRIDYKENENNYDGIDLRPEDLPTYQADQFKIGNSYYYSVRTFDDNFKQIPFFTKRKPILEVPQRLTIKETVDISSNPYAIDYFINQCLKENKFNKQILVKLSLKNVLNSSVNETIETANFVLSLFGGGIYSEQENGIKTESYKPKEDTIKLLKKYWGENANFRNINIYSNPELNNETTPVSQGQIVDTIIDEYINGYNGITPRDIFITAPTGAGKSLIFQLPAFYAALHKDVTIVVSPLKALMNDQVINLQNERHYNRVEFINSDLSLIDRDTIIKRCQEGEIDILYLSPELLLSYDIKYFIGERNLGLLIIDEAHLITTWGRDFRVDYWFLGNHIDKIRKYSKYKFPLVALTATAVYGGVNDMVFDSISSLNMHDPHKFIGEVKRNNIEFVIDTHDDYSAGKYDINKEKETVNIIKGLNALNLKSIIYAPYTSQIEALNDLAKEINPEMVVTYHGKMGQDEQKYSYNQFRNNEKKIMISTKAFGMGVDISDIQVVYHHAPSGLLPDYVQEIGRAARKDYIHGFAALTFSPSDLRYSKQLFGISSLKTFQLQEVMRKVYKFYEKNNKKRNMLLSANDFSYIFDASNEVEQKISTALMMIEKDYLVKYRFNVLIARPKRIFAKVFARTNQIGLSRLSNKYGSCFNIAHKHKNSDYVSIELNLEKIWSEHFSDKSFPQIKSEFYKKHFLKSEGIELTPQIKIVYTLEDSYNKSIEILQKILTSIKTTFARLRSKGAFFMMTDFKELLSKYLDSSYDLDKIIKFILSTYSGRLKTANELENDAFLQKRRNGYSDVYQVFNTNYEAKITQLLRIFSHLYEGNPSKTAYRFLSVGETPLTNHVRLGSLMELLGIGTFETIGGEDPKLFIRINDPRTIKKDSNDKFYKNAILESVKNRHRVSCKIFEHFFTKYLDNTDRWNLIEDFFLGASNDEILEKYPGSTRNHTDIIKYLEKNAKQINKEAPSSTGEIIRDFAPQEKGFYPDNRLLTINKKTKRIKEWLSFDPVLLHRTIEKYGINIEKRSYGILMSKLKTNHEEYFRDFIGLGMWIKFPGYDKDIEAMVVYSSEPVKFYKWWKKKENKNKVSLSFSEQIQLFLKVQELDSKALLKAHLEMIKK